MNFSRCLLGFEVNDDFNGLTINGSNGIEYNIEGNKSFIGAIGFGTFSFDIESVIKRNGVDRKRRIAFNVFFFYIF